MLPRLAEWQASLAETLTLPAIFTGQREDILRQARDAGLDMALAQDANEIFELYRLRATPSAIVVEADGRIGSVAVEGSPAIEALIRSVVARRDPPRLAIQPV
jgi:hypothetical protein